MILGRHLKLEIFGASHAPSVGLRLRGLPVTAKIDLKKLQAFVDRRAPGKDACSTARREPDRVELTRTAAGVVEALIRNTNVRSGDYEMTVPRPGHADFPNFVKTGRIPLGGGANSGRMTAPMCVAGGICLQQLARRKISVSARLVSCGGRPATAAKKTILAAKAKGDSVGGVIECTVTGLPVGLGGPMFDGLESALSQALFGIPGVKGVEFGNGFAAAALTGRSNNDAFVLKHGSVVTRTNRHGGILGGMTSGMPLVLRLALKPTPSIYLPQQSVDLKTMKPTTLRVRGRHDPCIALRAVPVVEALTAFVLYDALLSEQDASSVVGRVFGRGRVALPNIVIDATVARLYPELAADALLVLPSGEKFKTIATVGRLWKAFAKAGIGRKDVVTAIGGGVTNDLVGFAAATWMRGIDWISVPTTLLAMVDASYGGKTACDLPEGKNLAGAFHPPVQIVFDERFLKTLPPREIANGRAEMIKHDILAGNRKILSRAKLPTRAAILANRAVKVDLVRKDPFEKTGERAKLNLGHTLGHAVEKASRYRLSHGEAVAIGCVEEARLAERLKLAPAGLADAFAVRFAAAGLPTALPRGMTFEKLRTLMKHDKKNEDGKIVFALPCAWGDVRVVKL